MKPSPARLAVALLPAVAGGPAWGAGDSPDNSGMADDDARRRYADCTALVASDPGAALDSALEIDPLNPELLVDRAQAHAAAGGYWQAVDDLDQAIEYAPQRSDAYAFRAAAYRHLDILDLAADDVARALALAPDDPVILLERGNIRRLAGDDTGAREDWLRILTEAPASPAASAARTNIERLDVKQE